MTKTTAPVHKTTAMPHSTERYLYRRVKCSRTLAVVPRAWNMSDDAYFRMIAGSLGLGTLLAFALLVGLSFPNGNLPRDLAGESVDPAAETLVVIGKLQSR